MKGFFGALAEKKKREEETEEQNQEEGLTRPRLTRSPNGGRWRGCP